MSKNFKNPLSNETGEWEIATDLLTTAPADPDNWKIVAEADYRPDKDAYVEQAFGKKFPNITVTGATQIYALCSRSKVLNEWLAGVNITYVAGVKVPTFFKDLVTADAYAKAIAQTTKVGVLVDARVLAEQTAAKKYKTALKLAEKTYDDGVIGEKLTNVSKVLLLSSNSLPISVQLAIENYTPASTEAPDRRAYARECLITYKMGLLDLIIDDPSIKIDEVLDALATK